MRSWILLASLLSVSAFAGTAYKWVDENGTVHYSDRPQEGAQTVALPSAQGNGRSGANTQTATPNPNPVAQAAAQRPYERLDISTPTEQETLWNTGGNINVAVDISPGLRPGHRLVVYLDGTRLGFNPANPNFVVPEVFRGMHTLQLAVVDAFDEEQVRTHPRQFMVQQTSALNPQRANPGRAGN